MRVNSSINLGIVEPLSQELIDIGMLQFFSSIPSFDAAEKPGIPVIPIRMGILLFHPAGQYYGHRLANKCVFPFRSNTGGKI